MARVLPDHEQCDRHRYYKLSCGQYEELLARSGQKCEICRHEVNGVRTRKLAIDHSGPRWAVRGLLCTGCNARLGEANDAFPGARSYLKNAWWKQKCAVLGFPAGLPPEPPIASAIRNQHGIVWVRVSATRWEGLQLRGCRSSSTWERLYNAWGPHNLGPYDLRKAYDGGSLPREVRYPIDHSVSEGWVAVRDSLRLPLLELPAQPRWPSTRLAPGDGGETT